MGAIRIREPSGADHAAVAALLGELGYPAEAQALPARLAAMRRERIAALWVAEVDGRIVGLASAHCFSALHADAPVAYLSALVVCEDARRCGAGRALVEQAQSWARDRGAPRMSISVGAQRQTARSFYRAMGFEETGSRFAKVIG